MTKKKEVKRTRKKKCPKASKSNKHKNLNAIIENSIKTPII
jgi:hypothetical protein